jgi:hypothetical protein
MISLVFGPFTNIADLTFSMTFGSRFSKYLSARFVLGFFPLIVLMVLKERDIAGLACLLASSARLPNLLSEEKSSKEKTRRRGEKKSA